MLATFNQQIMTTDQKKDELIKSQNKRLQEIESIVNSKYQGLDNGIQAMLQVAKVRLLFQPVLKDQARTGINHTPVSIPEELKKGLEFAKKLPDIISNAVNNMNSWNKRWSS